MRATTMAMTATAVTAMVALGILLREGGAAVVAAEVDRG
jgi:hypothetical protein